MNFTAARNTMIDTQLRPNGVCSPDIIAAFRTVPREAFIANSQAMLAYGEMEIPLGPDRGMWSPMDCGRLITAVAPRLDDYVLVIGAGSGYEACILSRLTRFVIALENDTVFAKSAEETLIELRAQNVSVVEGDVKNGAEDQGPFDLIYVCGAVETLPEAWFAQLADGGRLAAVKATPRQPFTASVYYKNNGVVSEDEKFECVVPRFHAFDKAPTFQF